MRGQHLDGRVDLGGVGQLAVGRQQLGDPTGEVLLDLVGKLRVI